MASSSSSAPPSDAATEAAQLEELINETLRRELQSSLAPGNSHIIPGWLLIRWMLGQHGCCIKM